MCTPRRMKPYVALNIESSLSLRIWVGTVTTSVGMRMCDVPMVGQRSVRGVSETFRNFFSKHVFSGLYSPDFLRFFKKIKTSSSPKFEFFVRSMQQQQQQHSRSEIS